MHVIYIAVTTHGNTASIYRDGRNGGIICNRNNCICCLRCNSQRLDFAALYIHRRFSHNRYIAGITVDNCIRPRLKHRYFVIRQYKASGTTGVGQHDAFIYNALIHVNGLYAAAPNDYPTVYGNRIERGISCTDAIRQHKVTIHRHIFQRCSRCSDNNISLRILRYRSGLRYVRLSNIIHYLCKFCSRDIVLGV